MKIEYLLRQWLEAAARILQGLKPRWLCGLFVSQG